VFDTRNGRRVTAWSNRSNVVLPARFRGEEMAKIGDTKKASIVHECKMNNAIASAAFGGRTK